MAQLLGPCTQLGDPGRAPGPAIWGEPADERPVCPPVSQTLIVEIYLKGKQYHTLGAWETLGTPSHLYFEEQFHKT